MNSLNMEQRSITECVLLGDFIFHHACNSWCSAYFAALQLLGELAKDQWTSADVVEAVMRAESLNTQ